MANSSPPAKYVLVAHSGLGRSAVEHLSVDDKTARAVRKAGGVVCDAWNDTQQNWADGDALADAALLYPDSGIAPVGVRGRFGELLVRGLPVFLPDPLITTYARLLRGRRGVSRAELLEVAEGIVAERLPDAAAPARCAASPATGD